MNRGAGQTNPVNRKAVLWGFVCSALRFILHVSRKKTLIPYIYNLPTKTLSYILRETLLIQNRHGDRTVTLFYVIITARVICPTAKLLVDIGYQELN